MLLYIWAKEGVAPVCKYEDDLKVFHFSIDNASFCDGDYSYLDECI